MAQGASVDSTVRRITLDNGLQVIVAENHSVPIVTVLIAVRNGAMTQDSGAEGMAHLYEHLLFRSYKGDPDAFALEASDLDADWNGTTAEEVVTYYLAPPSKNALKAIALLARLVQRPRFSARDLKDERPVVLNELQRDEADPEQALERQALRMLWGASWSRKDVGGDSASLLHIDIPRLQQAYGEYYVPNNAALVVSGDVSTSDVFAAAKEQFGPWTRAPDPFAQRPVPAVAPLTASRALLMAKPVTHALILVKYRGPSAGQDTISPYALDLLCDVLNEHGSAFQRHLAGSGMFQSVQCGYETLAHVGPITFRGETTPERAPQALTALLTELDGLASMDGVTEEDLAIAKKRQRVSSELEGESSYALAPVLAESWSIGGAESYGLYERRVAAQRLIDVKDVATLFVSSQPRIIAVLAPPEIIPNLQVALRPAAGSIERAP
ncbi:MAG TPA: pitrilysin family protein [Gemmatimonadales bacterium]|nr:pitrilysin family protein [Gemmatimonadales bacterium]